MFRTVKVQLGGDTSPLLTTAQMYASACQIALNYSFEHRTYNKNDINTGTYQVTRKKMPQLPSGLVQTARDQASEMLKREQCKKLPLKKPSQIRYDRRTFKFYPESGYVSLSTVKGRLNFKVKIYNYIKQYLKGIYTNAQLTVRKKGEIFLNIQCEIPDVLPSASNSGGGDGGSSSDRVRVLGIDRGILNIVACDDDNTFVNSKHLRDVKGRYQYMKARLQSLGTRSAKRKLRRTAGRERRFTLNTNHVIAKRLVQKPYDVFAVEALQISRRKVVNGRKFNKLLGSWSYSQLLQIMKYKAENLGKIVVEVNPRHTSQRCSKCGYIDKRNRKGLRFKCRQCGFELNADLNAARNIGQLGKSEMIRLSLVNKPNVSPTYATQADTSPHPSGVGS